MTIRVKDELIPLNLLVIVLVAIIILFPSNVLRIILGLPFLLFFPGYTLVAALFTRKEGMGSIERVVLSFGLSIAVVPLVGLILNYTALGDKDGASSLFCGFIYIYYLNYCLVEAGAASRAGAVWH